MVQTGVCLGSTPNGAILKCIPSIFGFTGSLAVFTCAQKLGQVTGETQGRGVRHHAPVAAGRVLQPSELVGGMLLCSLQRGLMELPPSPWGSGGSSMKFAGGQGLVLLGCVWQEVEELGLGVSAALQHGMAARGVTGESCSTSTQIFG